VVTFSSSLYLTVSMLLSNINWIAVTIALNIIAYVSEFILDYRQSRKLKEATIPSKLSEYIDEEEFKEMKTYSLMRLNFSRLESTYGVISEIGILLCGVLVWTRRISTQIDLMIYDKIFPGSQPPDVTDDLFVIAQGVTFIFIVSLFSTIMKTPFEIYRIFAIDSNFQFNEKMMAYVMDQLKIFSISLIVGVPLLGLILKLIQIGSPIHWVYVWAGSAALVVGLSELYPNFLAPMFNSFRVLEDEELRKMIDKLALKVGFPPTEIVCMDGSTRSEHANA
jgi:STE24 endopeptidase